MTVPLLLLAALLLATLSCFAEATARPNKALNSTASATRPHKPSAGMTLADRAFMNLEYERADSLYMKMLENGEKNPDLYWKLARLNVSIAESFHPEETKNRLSYYRKAIGYARSCIALDSTNAAGHTWLAASLAVMADKVGTQEKLKRANEIKHELDLALELNPNDDIAWSILGSFYSQTAQIGWFRRFMGNAFVGPIPNGSRREAEQAFKKAISINPDVIRHYHELALLYIDEKRTSEALQLLQTAVDKPVLMKSDKRRLEEIRALITSLKE